MKNYNKLIQKLEIADQVLSRFFQNSVWHLDKRQEQVLKDCNKLKELITDVENIINNR